MDFSFLMSICIHVRWPTLTSKVEQLLGVTPVAEGKIEDAILVGDIRLPAEVPHGMRVIADIVAATGMPCMCVVSTRRC